MTRVTYEIVEHDGGWAYKAGGTYSETFRTRERAIAAATRAAEEQRIPGQDAAIAYQDGEGGTHEELVRGSDRPTTEVKC